MGHLAGLRVNEYECLLLMERKMAGEVRKRPQGQFRGHSTVRDKGGRRKSDGWSLVVAVVFTCLDLLWKTTLPSLDVVLSGLFKNYIFRERISI